LGREEAKAMKECKKLAKEGRLSACKILAKEVISTRQAVARMQIAKAQMNSVSMILQTSVSMIKMQGCMQKSSEIMASMNSLVKLPEIRATMQAMSTEVPLNYILNCLLIFSTVSRCFIHHVITARVLTLIKNKILINDLPVRSIVPFDRWQGLV
jgi:hypothetical protein